MLTRLLGKQETIRAVRTMKQGIKGFEFIYIYSEEDSGASFRTVGQILEFQGSSELKST